MIYIRVSLLYKLKISFLTKMSLEWFLHGALDMFNFNISIPLILFIHCFLHMILRPGYDVKLHPHRVNNYHFLALMTLLC
jgi:site-specific recombinase